MRADRLRGKGRALTIKRGRKTVLTEKPSFAAEGENLHPLLIKHARKGRYTVTATGAASGIVSAQVKVR